MGLRCSHRGKHPHPSSVVLTLSINFINVYAHDFAETIWRKMKTEDSRYPIPGLLCACVLGCSVVSLCYPMDCSPPGSSVCGIFQTRILELSFPSPGDLPDPGIELASPALQTDSLPLSFQWWQL